METVLDSTHAVSNSCMLPVQFRIKLTLYMATYRATKKGVQPVCRSGAQGPKRGP